jgi:hypothetical protein
MTQKKNEKHRNFIRQLPCVVCGKGGVQVAHIRYSEVRAGKANSGIGAKPLDGFTVPLCPECHRDQHQHGERKWWGNKNLDPIYIAMALWVNTGNMEAGCQIVRHAYFHS